MRNIAHTMMFLGIRCVLPIAGSLDGCDSVLCGVHSMGHGLQGAENMVGLPSRWAIIAGYGGWRRAKLVDGKDEDEVGEKRIRERRDRLREHGTRGDRSETIDHG